MKYKLDKGSHSVYSLQYHYVQCTKYRVSVLNIDGVNDFLKDFVRKISLTFGVEILNIESDKNHFHMIFKAQPKTELTKYINAIKTLTSREIQRKFPVVKKKLWGGVFWSPSYFLATTGQVTLEQLKHYVDNQGKKDA